MFTTIFLVFLFVLGAVAGSFINVVILRFNTGEDLYGRSKCASCSRTLSWWELFPIVSYILISGKCSTCRSKISLQYPLVEFAMASLFFLSALKFPFFFVFSYQSLISYILIVVIWSVLVILTVYDFKHKILPDIFVWSFVILAVVWQFVQILFETLEFSVLNFLAGPILFLFFFSFWYVSDGKWMGFGDAKLSIGIGFFLGLVQGISAVVLAFWIGAAVAVSILLGQKLSRKLQNDGLSLYQKNITMKSEIPFGPFLLLGSVIVFFVNVDILGLSALFKI